MKIGPLEIRLGRSLGPWIVSIDRRTGHVRRGHVREFGGIQDVGTLILQLETLLNGGTPNSYISRATQIAESIRKYRGQSPKGSMLAKNIINTRAAFTAARGLVFRGDRESAEGQFAKTFFDWNRLSLGLLTQLARERRFEGQVLLVLRPGPDGIPLVRYVSWIDTGYEVNADPADFGTIRDITYSVNLYSQAIAASSLRSRASIDASDCRACPR